MKVFTRRCEHDPPKDDAINASLLIQGGKAQKEDQSLGMVLCHKCARALTQRLLSGQDKRIQRQILQKLLDSVDSTDALIQINQLLDRAPT